MDFLEVRGGHTGGGRPSRLGGSVQGRVWKGMKKQSHERSKLRGLCIRVFPDRR